MPYNERGAGRPKGSLNKLNKQDLEKRIYDLETELAVIRAMLPVDNKKMLALLYAIGEKTGALALGIDPPEDDEDES
jgi:hypothetical protein